MFVSRSQKSKKWDSLPATNQLTHASTHPHQSTHPTLPTTLLVSSLSPTHHPTGSASAGPPRLRRFGALAQIVELFKEVASLLLPSWHGAPKLLDNASRFASDAVQLTLPAAWDVGAVTLRDAAGRSLATPNLTASGMLTLSAWPEGIYLIEIQHTAGTAIERVVVRR